MHKALMNKGLGPDMRVADSYRDALIEAGWHRA